ncbi:MAG TPA: hypothetical protein VMN60_01485 [Longimicrobiales bacterium]|nr:hypothetical protein [Longimicrobiales bacterium]
MIRSNAVLAVAFTLAACSSDFTSPTNTPSFARNAKESVPTATWYVTLNDAGLAVRSDGRYGSNAPPGAGSP